MERRWNENLSKLRKYLTNKSVIRTGSARTARTAHPGHPHPGERVPEPPQATANANPMLMRNDISQIGSSGVLGHQGNVDASCANETETMRTQTPPEGSPCPNCTNLLKAGLTSGSSIPVYPHPLYLRTPPESPQRPPNARTNSSATIGTSARRPTRPTSTC